MTRLARLVLAATAATMVLGLTMDASFAAKKRMGPIPSGACRVAGGYIPTGQACTGTTQYNMNQINWCSFGSLTPGILCAGGLCPAIKC